jgi:hypothetical protein
MSGIWGSFSFEHCSIGDSCTTISVIAFVKLEVLGGTIPKENPFSPAGGWSARVGIERQLIMENHRLRFS